jgi:hypothetical protein
MINNLTAHYSNITITISFILAFGLTLQMVMVSGNGWCTVILAAWAGLMWIWVKRGNER